MSLWVALAALGTGALRAPVALDNVVRSPLARRTPPRWLQASGCAGPAERALVAHGPVSAGVAVPTAPFAARSSEIGWRTRT
jgi:hypothetical protein